ncbi:MAG: hypothetical protein U1F65_06225 [Verrucomicrobiota bacterium]
MNLNTLKVVELLEGKTWFGAAGKQNDAEYSHAPSWLHALASCNGSDWMSVFDAGFEILTAKVQSRSLSRYQEWNVHIGEVRPLLVELIKRKAGKIMADHQLPEQFFWSVYAGLLGIAMECEYADIADPGFFTNEILPCYLRGHFPCGWEGQFPNGHLVVY